MFVQRVVKFSKTTTQKRHTHTFWNDFLAQVPIIRFDDGINSIHRIALRDNRQAVSKK